MLVKAVEITPGPLGSERLIYAGSHRSWSAVDIPSFLPREYFLRLLDAAEARLGRWLSHIDRGGKARHGKPPDNSSSSADPVAASDPGEYSLALIPEASDQAMRLPRLSEDFPGD